MAKHGIVFGLLAGVAAVVLPIIPASANTGDEAKVKATERWKPEDFVNTEFAGQMRLSPDGKWLVWVKSTVDKEKDGRASNLFLSSMSDKTEIQITRGSENNSQPRWSPDGTKIAFVSSKKREGAKPDKSGAQIWLINPHGGEPWPLTEFTRGPRQIDWLDKDTIIFSAEEDPSLYEQELKKKKDDSEIADDAEHEPPVRLFKISVKDKKVTRLTTNSDWIQDWAVSRDGKFAVARHGKSLHYTFDQKNPPITVLHDLTNGTEKQVFTEGRIVAEGLEWAADSSGFYLTTPYSTHERFLTANILLVYFYDVASGKSTKVDLDWENGVAFDLHAVPGGFLTLLAAGSHDELARYSSTKGAGGWSWKREQTSGENTKNLQSFEVSDDGKIVAYQASTASRMPQIYHAALDGAKLGAPIEVSKLNENLVNGRAYAKTEIIRWKGANDEEVEGVLYYPTSYEAGKRYPVITAIHGGPTGSDKDLWDESWAYPIQLFTQQGAFVLRPNYHGSNNYGLKWVESICCGKYYDLETPDINAGVDYLISKGMGDPDRVGTMGWSNGSILSTSLLVTYPDRYKVAAVGAGDVEWISDWGNVDFGESFDAYYFGKSPMQDPDLYIRKSPFFKMDRIKAPVLIFHGNADRNVPFAQSWSYFRALQYYDKVPVKFVIFPGEPHGPRKLTHQLRKVSEEETWFAKYFFKNEKTESNVVKKGSQLEFLSKLEAAKTKNGVYGQEAAGKDKALIPEVVRRGDLEIGRFEVTLGQNLEYLRLRNAKGKTPAAQPRQKPEEMTSRDYNNPVSKVSIDDAKAYAAWLSEETGQTWRLPYEDEVKGLYENREDENTLDYWADYAPNPEDTTKLREAAKKLNGTAPLLKQVGSFKGHGKDGEEPVYDLGGNVAEWVLTRDGQGKVIGGSADCPADPKTNCTPAPEYVGFRVVRGAAKPAPAAEKQ